MKREIFTLLFLSIFFVSFCCVEEVELLSCGNCDDNNPCTSDYCLAGKCFHKPLSGNVSGCFRVENCTLYSCVNGTCLPTLISNCCGNGICEENENCSNCEVDCGSCIKVENLRVPSVPKYPIYELPPKPEVNSVRQIPVNLRFVVNTYKIYNGSGGVLEIYVENEDPKAYLYNLTILTNYSKTAVLPGAWIIEESEEKRIGMVFLPGPEKEGNYTYKICSNIISTQGGLSYEYKNLCTSEIKFEALNPPEPSNYSRRLDQEISKKISNYLDDSESIEALVNESVEEFPGGYNIYQISYLFDWVKENIEYRKIKEFMNASEVMERKVGDCKHFSILLTTFIKKLGGASRIFLTKDHMFTTFFAGNSTTFPEIVRGIRDYYGDEIPVYYIKDEIGYWVILDGTCSNYVGGLPCDAVPTRENFKFVNLTSLRYTEVYYQ